MTIVVMEEYFIVSPNPLDLVKVVVVSENLWSLKKVVQNESYKN